MIQPERIASEDYSSEIEPGEAPIQTSDDRNQAKNPF
jgi:hypothetical protein